MKNNSALEIAQQHIVMLERRIEMMLSANLRLVEELKQAKKQLQAQTPITIQQWHKWNREFRETVLKRDGNTCQDCGDSSCRLVVHHIYLKSLYPERQFDPNNGVALCHECHRKRHSGSNHYRRRAADRSLPVVRHI